MSGGYIYICPWGYVSSGVYVLGGIICVHGISVRVVYKSLGEVSGGKCWGGGGEVR